MSKNKTSKLFMVLFLDAGNLIQVKRSKDCYLIPSLFIVTKEHLEMFGISDQTGGACMGIILTILLRKRTYICCV